MSTWDPCCNQSGLSFSTEDESFHTPAWNTFDLWDMVLDEDIVTGEVLIPHAPGRVIIASDSDSSKVTIDFWITGEIDPKGAPYDDDEDGFATNIQFFRDAFTNPAPGDGTHSGTIVTPGGSFTHPVKFGPLRLGKRMALVPMGDGVYRRAAAASVEVELLAGTMVTFDDIVTMGIAVTLSPTPDGCYPPPLRLAIEGRPLNWYAWNIPDLWELLLDPDYRGGTFHIPGTVGRISYPNRADLTTYDFDLWITGEVTPEGVPTDDDVEGFFLNLMWIRQYYTSPILTGIVDTQRVATLTLPDHSTIAKNVRVRPLRLNRTMDRVAMGDGTYRWASKATFSMDIPTGAMR